MFENILKRVKSGLNKHDGLGYLQFYSLLKTLSVVVIAIIFARGISIPEIINQWETFLLMGTAFTFFYVSGLGYTLVSFVKKYQSDEWNKIFGTTFLTLLILSICSVTLIISTAEFFWPNQLPLSHLLLFCMYLIGNIVATVVEYFFYLNKGFKKLLIWGILNFALMVLAPTLPLLLGYNFIYSFYLLAIVGLIKLIYTIYILKNPFENLSKSHFWALAKYNFPVILSLLTGTGYVYIAHFMLKAQVDVMDFNLFRYGSREFPVFIVMANSFSIVLGGITTSKYLKPGFWQEVKKSHQRLMHQLFPLAILLMLGSRFLFTLVFSSDFSAAYLIFNILLLTLIPRLLFPQSLLLGISKTKYSFYASLIEFSLGILLVYTLIPIYGIFGASIGMVIAYFIEKLVLIFYCYKEKIDFMQSLNIKFFLMYSTLLIAAFLLSIVWA